MSAKPEFSDDPLTVHGLGPCRRRSLFDGAGIARSGAPELAAASPAPNPTVGAPKHITMRFDEKLMAKFSSANLVMTDMPGMKMNAPMKMPATSMVYGADGKSLMLMPSKPLPAGTYRVNYGVVADDSHRITGHYPEAGRRS